MRTSDFKQVLFPLLLVGCLPISSLTAPINGISFFRIFGCRPGKSEGVLRTRCSSQAVLFPGPMTLHTLGHTGWGYSPTAGYHIRPSLRHARIVYGSPSGRKREKHAQSMERFKSYSGFSENEKRIVLPAQPRRRSSWSIFILYDRIFSTPVPDELGNMVVGPLFCVRQQFVCLYSDLISNLMRAT